ncbi:sulfatase [Fulvivirga sp. M361]|uniref:sulfatase n=1 Tax=Fulvivirga sp. M361 TaxID=2594266 RepID=UPI001629BDB0|nr:sulfatase [Fulvivirga sp. M361]
MKQLTIIVFILCSTQAVLGQNEKLNVLFIAVDDLNDWVGVLNGHPNAITPNIDGLAGQSTLFTMAYPAAPLCNPSRSALLTGIHPFTSGVYDNKQPLRNSEVLKEAHTLPEYFRKNGYKTMGSGKVFHYRHDTVSWDYYWPSNEQIRPEDPAPPEVPMHGMPMHDRFFDWGALDVEPSEMGDWKVADWVSNQLNIDHEKPFFLACGFYKPHLPWYIPKSYFDRYPLDEIRLPEVNKNDLDDVPAAGRGMAKLKILKDDNIPGDSVEGDHARVLRYDKWKEGVQAYLAALTLADECLGRVLDALENSKYKNNTIVVLWSDHGWHLGEKRHWRKATLWEESTRSLLMFKVPGVTQAGSKVDWPVSLIDIYPTLLDLTRLPQKNDLEGSSLHPLLKDPSREWDKPVVTTYRYKNHSVRSKRYRYIRYADGTEELYDHAVDPLEWINLAGQSLYDPIKAELTQLLPETNAPYIPNDSVK